MVFENLGDIKHNHNHVLLGIMWNARTKDDHNFNSKYVTTLKWVTNNDIPQNITYASMSFNNNLLYCWYSSSPKCDGSCLACSYKSQNWCIILWPLPLSAAASVVNKYARKFSLGCR